MLSHVNILLSDASVAFCHYSNEHPTDRLIDVDMLKSAIKWAMCQNLMVHFVYPDFALPEKYNTIIESVDHDKIKSVEFQEGADIIVVNGIANLNKLLFFDKPVTLIVEKDDLFNNFKSISYFLNKVKRLNVVILGIETFQDSDFSNYETLLAHLSEDIKQSFLDGSSPQINILTDRILLDEMRNCNAGVDSITVAPNGKFYICPAFYFNNCEDIGSLQSGLDIKNQHLYKIEKSAICRICDAYHCKRCVWLNKKTTLEVLTPSREQCVISHIERNASRKILNSLRQYGEFMEDKKIMEIDYLDPFDKIKES